MNSNHCRRALLQAAALTACCFSIPSFAHNRAGRVVPAQTAPKISLTLHTGEKTDLHSLTRGKATALQLMFTTCSSLCPIQGALFQSAQGTITDPIATEQGMRLLSISIDPLNDDPERMRKWLQRHEARPWWVAATPNIRQLDALFDWLDARAQGADRHTPQVYFLNRDAALALRSIDFPSGLEVARSLYSLSSIRKLA